MALPRHTQAFLDQLQRDNVSSIQAFTPQDLRQKFAQTVSTYGAPHTYLDHVEDVHIRGSDGHTLALRLYRPSRDLDHIWLYAHGGGWMRGSVQVYDTHLRQMATHLDATILSLEYRLSPEYPFPHAHQDTYDAYLWMRHNMPYERYWIGGDSAGGNLTAGVVCRLIEERCRLPHGYIGIYPSLDLRLQNDSYQRFSKGYLLTTQSVCAYVDTYLNGQSVHAYNAVASPFLYWGLDQFPKTLMITASHDPLYDEQIAFVERLREGGVEVQHSIVEGMIHPFMLFPRIFEESYHVMRWLKQHMCQ